jgi:DNA replicative helicase MCM subunit Mcm2 (Cdc46/Mcm family)
VFVYFQKLRVQEIKKNLSNTHIPRTIDLYIRYNYSEIIKLGGKFIFSGSLMVLPIKKLSDKKNTCLAIGLQSIRELEKYGLKLNSIGDIGEDFCRK